MSDNPDHGREADQQPRPGAVRQPDRHDDRVLRLLHLRHRGGAGVPAAVLSRRPIPASATLASLATFAIAFFARPIGSALFGHFGDRIGRKTTLVAALLTMGVSTVAIGLLPTYATIGVAAPLLLALCRFGQGLGLGGEWGGAVLLAIENAPPGKRAWYGMFPQLGAPIGFFFSGGIFLLLSRRLTDEQFFAFGWRLPFLASAVLVARRPLRAADDHRDAGVPRGAQAPRARRGADGRGLPRPLRHAVPRHPGVARPTFVLFYLMTVFALSWGTSALGYTPREVPA